LINLEEGTVPWCCTLSVYVNGAMAAFCGTMLAFTGGKGYISKKTANEKTLHACSRLAACALFMGSAGKDPLLFRRVPARTDSPAS
jgi:hypothetical protein